MMQIDCVMCGTTFTRRSSRQKYCRTKCKKEARAKKAKDALEAGRNITCVWCNKTFWVDNRGNGGRYPNYCGVYCRVRNRRKYVRERQFRKDHPELSYEAAMELHDKVKRPKRWKQEVSYDARVYAGQISEADMVPCLDCGTMSEFALCDDCR